MPLLCIITCHLIISIIILVFPIIFSLQFLFGTVWMLLKEYQKFTFFIVGMFKRQVLSYICYIVYFSSPYPFKFFKGYLSKSKKPTISGKIVGLLKFVGEIQQLLRKHSQKNNQSVILHYILLPIYPLQFLKFCPIQKQ